MTRDFRFAVRVVAIATVGFSSGALSAFTSAANNQSVDATVRIETIED
nr:hypothetical protein [Burkholderia diffusa]